MASHQQQNVVAHGGDGGTTQTAEPATSNEQELEKVVVYLTQNSTTHHKDEVPETLAAMQKAEKSGLEARSVLPISDPYSDGTQTYEGAFGDAAADMTWWHDNEDLKEGQLQIGDRTLTLGSSGEPGEVLDAAAVSEDWRFAMEHIGLSEERAEEVIQAMFRDEEGNAVMNASTGGASNELLQLISVMNRAEEGEFELDGLVLSGHHYKGTDYLFGEKGNHQYDMNDKLNMNDIESLAGVFTTASAGIDDMMFSACNTNDLGMTDDEGNELSTNQWLQGMFPNIERSSYWNGIAPGPDMGAFFSGEFMLDAAREEGGQTNAFNDAKFRKTSKGQNLRSELNEDGVLEEFETKAKGSSYYYNDYKGYRNSSHQAYHKRSDLMEHIYDGPEKKPE